MPKVTLHGTVKDGRYISDYPSVFRNALKQYEGKRVSISVNLFKRPRSPQQNKFLHVVYELIAAESGHTAKEVAEVCKSRFLPPQFICDTAVTGTTTKLSTVEFEVYIERIRVFALDYWSMEIPTPTKGVDYE